MSRPVSVLAPPGAEVLQFRQMDGGEDLGRLFEFNVDLISTDPEIDLGGLVGKTMAVQLELPQGGVRFFHGVIASFDQVSDLGRYAEYRAVLRPWLWRLTLRAGCRIFQNMTVPEIVKSILREHGLTDFVENLSGSYPSQEFTVQYRETDFNFVSRLMEREGIYYFFEHQADRHTLVLADGYSAHESQATRRYRTIPSKRRGDVRETISTSGRFPRSSRPAHAFSMTTTSRAPRPT